MQMRKQLRPQSSMRSTFLEHWLIVRGGPLFDSMLQLKISENRRISGTSCKDGSACAAAGRDEDPNHGRSA